ncbi:MAG: amidohydrolase family protein [Gemmatimonadota bacterium]
MTGRLTGGTSLPGLAALLLITGAGEDPGRRAGGVVGVEDARPPAQLVVTGANVLDVRTGKVRRGRTIVVDAGRISAVLAPDAPSPDARRTVEARGRLVVPGLVDAHSHLAMILGDSVSSGGGLITSLSADPDSITAYRSRYAGAYIPYGVTTVRDVGSSEADLRLLVDWMNAPAADIPDVYPTGGALVSHEEDRTPFPGHRVVTDPDDARETVRRYHDLGLRHVKLYWRLREPEFRAALSEAEQLGMIPTGHIDFHVLDIDRALDLGLRSFEHAYTLGVSALGREEYLEAWREHLPRWIGDRRRGRFYLGVVEYFNVLGPDDPRMERLIGRLAGSRSVVVPTSHLFAQRFGLAPFDSPRLGAFDDVSDLTAQQLAHARDGYRILADYIRRMHTAGITLATGSDWVEPGKAILSEIWLLAEAGIPMADSLRIATLGGARALGLEDDIGAVEPGMKAHLVIFHQDPFTDPAAIFGARTVIKDGRVVGACVPAI